MIRPVKLSDAEEICGIYNYYIENTVITFEETPLPAREMEERIWKILSKYPYFVWEDEGEVTGYTYINTWKERAAYRYAAELSIYLKNGRQGQGTGRLLLTRLLEEVRKTDVHALVSGITLPNDRSVGLHEKSGFKKIAQFNEIGYKHGRWLDVGYWELVLKAGKTGNG
ncbi:MAG: GNAT family N-acetyltransferase [Treponema sp.]|jgi:phosphinothricin acetyltransferase|nr:GNAT family N-acetyltransferase [Treponema sp.]